MNLAHAPYLFVASMNVHPSKDGVFNEVYDSEHIPNALTVPGILGAVRYRKVALDLAIGGKVQRSENSFPIYTAIYGVEQPEVLVSEEWARTVELGRWPASVRPFTADRQHILLERIAPNGRKR